MAWTFEGDEFMWSPQICFGSEAKEAFRYLHYFLLFLGLPELPMELNFTMKLAKTFGGNMSKCILSNVFVQSNLGKVTR